MGYIHSRRYHFEISERTVEHVNEELTDNELEIAIVKISNLKSDISHPYVSIPFPYPSAEAPQKIQTEYKSGSNPGRPFRS